MRILLAVAGFLTILLGSVCDVEALGDFAVPLWLYLAAHLAILAGVFSRGAMNLKRLAFVLPVFALTIPMTCRAMSSLGHHLFQIQPGMTILEVRRIMAGFKEGTGLTSPYTGKEFVPAGCLIFRDPRHSEANMARGTVNIRNGRVTGVYIAPD